MDGTHSQIVITTKISQEINKTPSGTITQPIDVISSYQYIYNIMNELSLSTGAIIRKEDNYISGSNIDNKYKVFF